MVPFPSATVLPLILGQPGEVLTEAEKDLSQLTNALPILQAIPAADLLLGGLTLILIAVLHGSIMRAVSGHAVHRATVIERRPTEWRADLLLAGAIFFLLLSHLLEILAWTAVLLWARLVPTWREAAYFVANTYTTLGYGKVLLAEPWKMLAPFIAISGLFSFGWTGSVLVDLVSRVNRLKDLAQHRDAALTPVTLAPETASPPPNKEGPGPA